MPGRALLGPIRHPAGVWTACRICQLAVMLARDMTTTDASALLFSSAPGRWVVAVTVLGSGIAALDATVVNIALPTIGREFHVGVGALQWVMSGYTLTLAAFALCAAGGLLAAVTITNPSRAPRPAGASPPAECLHCGLEAPPLRTSVSNQLAPGGHPSVPAVTPGTSRDRHRGGPGRGNVALRG